MNLTNFYNNRSGSASYHLSDRKGLINRQGLRRLVAFDDRFATVVDKLSSLIDGMAKNDIKLKILDIGCGDGVYESLLPDSIRSKADFYGIDLSKEQLKRATKFFVDTKVVDTDGQKIPYASMFFDIIMCSEVLEHVFYPEKIFTEANRLLRSDGKLLITVPNFGSLQIRLTTFFSGSSPLVNYSRNQEHIRFYSPKDIRLLAKNEKFMEILYFGIGSLYFDNWNFWFRLPVLRVKQRLFNRFLPQLATGLLFVFKKK